MNTQTHTLPHSFNQKSVIPSKVQTEISTDDSEKLAGLKVSLDLLLG